MGTKVILLSATFLFWSLFHYVAQSNAQRIPPIGLPKGGPPQAPVRPPPSQFGNAPPPSNFQPPPQMNSNPGSFGGRPPPLLLQPQNNLTAVGMPSSSQSPEWMVGQDENIKRVLLELATMSTPSQMAESLSRVVQKIGPHFFNNLENRKDHIMIPGRNGSQFPGVANMQSDGVKAMLLQSVRSSQLSNFDVWYLTSVILRSIDDRLKPDYVFLIPAPLQRGIPAHNISQVLLGSLIVRPEVLRPLIEESSGMLVSQKAVITQRIRHRLGEPGILRNVLSASDPSELLSLFSPRVISRNMAPLIKTIVEMPAVGRFGITSIQAKLLPPNILSLWLNWVREQTQTTKWTAEDLLGRSPLGSAHAVSFAILGLTCKDVGLIDTIDILPVIFHYRHEISMLAHFKPTLSFSMNLRVCLLDKVVEYLKIKRNLSGNTTDSGNVLALLNPGEVMGIGGEILSLIPTRTLEVLPLETRMNIVEEIGGLNMLKLFTLVSLQDLHWYGNSLVRDIQQIPPQVPTTSAPSRLPGRRGRDVDKGAAAKNATETDTWDDSSSTEDDAEAPEDDIGGRSIGDDEATVSDVSASGQEVPAQVAPPKNPQQAAGRTFSSSNEVGLDSEGIQRLGNLLCYAEDIFAGNWASSLLKGVLESKSVPGEKTCCLSRVLRTKWFSLLQKAFGTDTSSWSEFDLASIGDLLVVLPQRDLNQISPDALSKAVRPILEQSGFDRKILIPGKLRESRWVEECGEALLAEGPDYLEAYKGVMRKLSQAAQVIANSVKTSDEVVKGSPRRMRRWAEWKARVRRQVSLVHGSGEIAYQPMTSTVIVPQTEVSGYGQSYYPVTNYQQQTMVGGVPQGQVSQGNVGMQYSTGTQPIVAGQIGSQIQQQGQMGTGQYQSQPQTQYGYQYQPQGQVGAGTQYAYPAGSNGNQYTYPVIQGQTGQLQGQSGVLGQTATQFPGQTATQMQVGTQLQGQAGNQFQGQSGAQVQNANFPGQTATQIQAGTQIQGQAGNQFQGQSGAQVQNSNQFAGLAATQIQAGSQLQGQNGNQFQGQSGAQVQNANQFPGQTASQIQAGSQLQGQAGNQFQAQNANQFQGQNGGVTGAQFQQPAVTQFQQPAVNQFQQPAVTQFQQPAVTQFQQPAVTQFQQPAVTQFQQPAGSQFQDQSGAQFQGQNGAQVQTGNQFQGQNGDLTGNQFQGQSGTQLQTPAVTQFKTPVVTQFQQPTATQFQQPADSQFKGQTGTQFQGQSGNQFQAQTGNQFQDQTATQFQGPTATQFQGQSGSQVQTAAPFPGQSGNQFQGQTGNQFQSQPGNQFQGQTGNQFQTQTGNQFQGQAGIPFQAPVASQFQGQSGAQVQNANQFPGQTATQIQAGSQLQGQNGNQFQGQSGAQVQNANQFQGQNGAVTGAQFQQPTGSQILEQPGAQFQTQPGTQFQGQTGTQFQTQPGTQFQGQTGTQFQQQTQLGDPGMQGRTAGTYGTTYYYPQQGQTQPMGGQLGNQYQQQGQTGMQGQAQPGTQYQRQYGTQLQAQPGTQFQGQTGSQFQQQTQLGDPGMQGRSAGTYGAPYYYPQQGQAGSQMQPGGGQLGNQFQQQGQMQGQGQFGTQGGNQFNGVGSGGIQGGATFQGQAGLQGGNQFAAGGGGGLQGSGQFQGTGQFGAGGGLQNGAQLQGSGQFGAGGGLQNGAQLQGSGQFGTGVQGVGQFNSNGQFEVQGGSSASDQLLFGRSIDNSSSDASADGSPAEITCHGIKIAGPAAIGLTIDDLDKLTPMELFDCIEPLGALEWDLQSKRAILDLFTQKLFLSTDKLNTLTFIELGNLVTAIPVGNEDFVGNASMQLDLSQLDLTLPESLDTIAILGSKIADPTIVKVLAEKFNKDNRIFLGFSRGIARPENLRITVLSLGNILCGFSDKVVHSLFESDASLFIDCSSTLGKLDGCPPEVLTTLASHAIRPSNYGQPRVWTAEDLETIGVVFAGLKPDSISSIPPEAMQGLKPRAVTALPPSSFVALSPQQISKMSYTAALAVHPSQINGLSPTQAEALRQVVQVANDEFDVAGNADSPLVEGTRSVPELQGPPGSNKTDDSAGSPTGRSRGGDDEPTVVTTTTEPTTSATPTDAPPSEETTTTTTEVPTTTPTVHSSGGGGTKPSGAEPSLVISLPLIFLSSIASILIN